MELYSDEHIAILNKGGDVFLEDVAGPELTPCHQLDFATSGILVFSKSAHGASFMGRCFGQRKVTKVYLALVHGRLETIQLIDTPLVADSTDPNGFKQVPSGIPLPGCGKEALTLVQPLEVLDLEGKTATLVQLRLYTGRRHQLRVHLSTIGHPIVGDISYGGGSEYTRMMLHASHISFPSPSNHNESVTISCPVTFAPRWISPTALPETFSLPTSILWPRREYSSAGCLMYTSQLNEDGNHTVKLLLSKASKKNPDGSCRKGSWLTIPTKRLDVTDPDSLSSAAASFSHESLYMLPSEILGTGSMLKRYSLSRELRSGGSNRAYILSHSGVFVAASYMPAEDLEGLNAKLALNQSQPHTCRIKGVETMSWKWVDIALLSTSSWKFSPLITSLVNIPGMLEFLHRPIEIQPTTSVLESFKRCFTAL